MVPFWILDCGFWIGKKREPRAGATSAVSFNPKCAIQTPKSLLSQHLHRRLQFALRVCVAAHPGYVDAARVCILRSGDVAPLLVHLAELVVGVAVIRIGLERAVQVIDRRRE